MDFFSIFFKKYIDKQFSFNLLSWSIVTLIIFFLLGANTLGSEAPSIAVYYFHNQTGNNNLEWLEENLPVSIDQTLSKIEQISYIPLSEVNKIADYQQYKDMVQKKDSMLFGQLANLLQVDLIFSGNYYQEEKDQIELDLLMYLTSDGYLVEFRRMSASLENLTDLKEKIIEIILQEAGIDPKFVSLENIVITEEVNEKDDQKSEEFVSEDYPRENKSDLQANSLALEYYNKAIELKDKAILEYGGADYPSKPLWNEAIQNATKAVEVDPNFAEGYYLLSEIYRRTKWIIREIESLEQYIATVNRTNKQVDDKLFSDALTRLAHLKYYTNDKSSAINYLEEAISYNPNNVEARTYLMRIYYDTGQGEKALQQAEEIKRIQPDIDIELDWFARRTQRISLYGKEAFDNYENGYNSYIAKNYREAIRYLEQAISLAPAFEDAHYYLALSYYHYGDLPSAIQHWEETLKLDSFDTNARIYLNKALEEHKYGRDAVWSFNEGYKHYIAGEYEEALVEFKKSTNLNPNFEKARTLLMRTYYHLEQMDEYLAERKRITENSNFTGEIEKEYYQLGYDFYSLGDYEVAYERLRDSLEINPDYLEARFLIAETLYQLQDYEKSNIHYQYIIDNYSESEYYEDALLGSGWCNYLLDNYQQAEKYLEILVENFPKSLLYQEAVYKLGRVYFIQEKYQNTIDSYEELLRLESLEYDEEEINYLLAQSYFWIEDYGRAKELLLDIIENNPDFKQIDEAKYYYSYIFFKEKQYLEAKNLLKELVKKENSKINAEVSYLLGRTLIELKEYDKVIEINSSLLNKEIEEYIMERVLFDLGLAYSRKGEDKEAIEFFNRVIDNYPQGELATLSKIEVAQSYYHLGQYQDSLDILENITTKEGLELKIDSARKLGKEELLVSIYEEYKEKFPDDELPVEDYYSLAIIQFNDGEFRKAIETLKFLETENIDENLKREVNYWLGLSFYRIQEYEQAKDYFQRNDQLPGDDISIKSLYMLAESCYQLEEYSQAINYYSEFLQNYSTHSLAEHVYYSISWSYLNNNNYEKALSSFESLIEKFPESQFIEESFFLKGKIEFLLSDNQNARQTLLEFIEKDPDKQYKEESLYIIAQINLEEQQWIDSILYFERLIKEYPNSRYLSGSLYGLCLSYYQKDEYNKALNVGQRYLNSFDEGTFVCDIIYITAICQEEIGNTDEAIKQYEKIISDCPESTYVDSAKEQIEFLNMQ
jgi:tetratricopeptide (TPR) repeat protein